MVQRGDRVCISINFNFCTWYEVKIRFNDNLQQKETKDDIILVQENTVCNLQIR